MNAIFYIFERRAVRLLAYVAFTVVMFLTALVLTFPADRVKQIVSVQIERALGYGYEVQIGDLDLWWLMGLELHDVVLKERWTPEQIEEANKAAEDEDGPLKVPLTVTVPRIAGRFAPGTSILNFAPAATFAVDFEDGGIITGTYAHKSSGPKIHMDFDTVDLMRSSILLSITGIPGFGDLDGTIDLVMDPKTRGLKQGDLDLKGSKLTIGPGFVETDKIPSMLFIKVPQTNFGNLAFKAKIDTPKNARQARFTIEEFTSQGRDVRMEMWGYVSLARRLGASKANTKMRMQFDARFVRDNDLAPLLNIKQFRTGKGPENWYGFSILGMLSKVNFSGSVQAARGPSSDPKAKAGPAGVKTRAAGAKPGAPGARPGAPKVKSPKVPGKRNVPAPRKRTPKPTQ